MSVNIFDKIPKVAPPLIIIAFEEFQLLKTPARLAPFINEDQWQHICSEIKKSMSWSRTKAQCCAVFTLCLCLYCLMLNCQDSTLQAKLPILNRDIFRGKPVMTMFRGRWITFNTEEATKANNLDPNMTQPVVAQPYIERDSPIANPKTVIPIQQPTPIIQSQPMNSRIVSINLPHDVQPGNILTVQAPTGEQVQIYRVKH